MTKTKLKYHDRGVIKGTNESVNVIESNKIQIVSLDDVNTTEPYRILIDKVAVSLYCGEYIGINLYEHLMARYRKIIKYSSKGGTSTHNSLTYCTCELVINVDGASVHIQLNSRYGRGRYNVRLEYNPDKVPVAFIRQLYDEISPYLPEIDSSELDRAIRISRLDLAIDYHGGFMPELAVIKGLRSSKGFCSSKGIETLYFGGDRAKTKFRLYDKTKELTQAREKAKKSGYTNLARRYEKHLERHSNCWRAEMIYKHDIYVTPSTSCEKIINQLKRLVIVAPNDLDDFKSEPTFDLMLLASLKGGYSMQWLLERYCKSDTTRRKYKKIHSQQAHYPSAEQLTDSEKVVQNFLGEIHDIFYRGAVVHRAVS